MDSIGEVIRDLRLAHGWSQARLADLLCELSGRATLTREEVSRWERTTRCPGPYWLRYLATALEVPFSVLEDAVKRRTFLTDLAATAIAPAVASDLIECGFDAAWGARPSLDDWRAELDAYGRRYMCMGAAEIQSRLARDMVVLQQQVDSSQSWHVAAILMTLYGKTFPGADGARTITWYRKAAVAADRSDDLASRVWVRGRAAIALGYEGACLPYAERFADDALAISDTPSLGRLNATIAKAHIAALRGNRPAATKLLDDGRRLFDLAGSDELDSDYAVPEWRMAVFSSLLHARLGDESAALAAQDTARRTLPASLPRFATHLDMHRGLMIARAGDPSEGISHARAALERLPVEKQSLTLRLLMAEVENGQKTGH